MRQRVLYTLTHFWKFAGGELPASNSDVRVSEKEKQNGT